MEAFCTVISWRIEAITSLIPMYLYLLKISGHQQLNTTSLLSNHMINSLFENRHVKNSLLHCLSLKKLTPKQQLKVKSSIIDTNNYLNGIFFSFDPFHKELSSSFRLVDNFSDHFSFHIVNYKDKKSKEAYLCKLNKFFEDILLDSNSIIIISDASIRNNITMLIVYIQSGHIIIAKTIHYAINIISSTKAKLFTIRCRINQAIQVFNASYIIIITDSIYLANQIFDSSSYSYQLQFIAIAQDLSTFFKKTPITSLISRIA